jgi:hypothetical protein
MVQSQQKVALKTELRMELAKNTAPLPQEIVSKLSALFITDFIDVMRSHSGFALEDKFRSVQTTFDLFRRAYDDLQQSLDEFDAFSRTGEFHHRVSRARHDAIESKIRKELYCFSSLAHSLQDHCRRVTDEWLPDDFRVQLEICFGSDGLHDFICGLRTAMHHRSMAEADWVLKDFGHEMSSHYVLHRRELLDIEKTWNRRARGSLENMVEEIDVRTLSTEYIRRAAQFCSWLFTRIRQDMPPSVRDFRRCWDEHEKLSLRMTWNLLLGTFLKQQVDPYPHLSKYLTSPQLEEAMSLPMRSKEQVDFIIRIVDERCACTDKLRTDAYRLFGALTGP